jgi:hypothetical protein
MGTKIVFAAETEVVLAETHPADLAQELAIQEGPKWAGGFLYLGNDIWVNPQTVAYLEQVAD